MNNYSITDKQLEDIIKAAADEAVMKYVKTQKENTKKEYDQRLYNTKILLENYQSLNMYAETAIYSIDQILDSDTLSYEEVELLMKCGLKEDDLIVQSVASGVVRVKVLMAQVNKMIEIYREDCLSSSSKTKQRQYRALEKMYLCENRMTAQDIADEEGEEIRTIQNDLKRAREELTPLIFGIDALLVKILKK